MLSCFSHAQLCTAPRQATAHGILQARTLEWVAIPSSRGLPNPGIEPRSPALQEDSLASESPGKPRSALKLSQTKAGHEPFHKALSAFSSCCLTYHPPLESCPAERHQNTGVQLSFPPSEPPLTVHSLSVSKRSFSISSCFTRRRWALNVSILMADRGNPNSVSGLPLQDNQELGIYKMFIFPSVLLQFLFEGAWQILPNYISYQFSSVQSLSHV